MEGYFVDQKEFFWWIIPYDFNAYIVLENPDDGSTIKYAINVCIKQWNYRVYLRERINQMYVCA